MSILERFGWGPFFEQQLTPEDRANFRFSRVVEDQRGLSRVAGEFNGWATIAGRLRLESIHPAVGDWVRLKADATYGEERRTTGAAEESGNAVIDRILERRSKVSRAAAGEATVEQIVAANVDTIFIVTTVTEDLNARRIERYLTMVWEAGAVPVVLLNKADLRDDVTATCDALRSRLPFVDVHPVSALGGGGLDALTRYLRPAQTVGLVGSSGVGKSTLVNRLLGRDLQKVNAIRESDGRGRHTTASRQLIELPGGALLIDTPGMRELQLWSTDTGLDAAFDDIVSLAAECRFADCCHSTEPGCAVLEAVEAGRLDRDRLENYHKLRREADYENRKHDKAAAAEHKRRWKQIHQAQKAMYKERDRS